MNAYHFYGLTVATPFPCPELLPSSDAPDVVVHLENIDDAAHAWNGRGVCYRAAPGKYLLEVTGIARYLLTDGKHIAIEKSPAADEDALRLFFYNEVAAALLMQRGMLVLKASVVARDGKAYVLPGRTSVGKSMSAAGLANLGFAIVSDGVCAINAQGEVMPGLPFLMLWKKGLPKLAVTAAELKPVRQGMNKFYFPVTPNFINQPLPVAGIYPLSECNRMEYASCAIAGADKFFSLLNYCYHSALVQPMGMTQTVTKLAALTAKRVTMKRIEFNMEASSFNDYTAFLAKELGAEFSARVKRDGTQM